MGRQRHLEASGTDPGCYGGRPERLSVHARHTRQHIREYQIRGRERGSSATSVWSSNLSSWISCNLPRLRFPELGGLKMPKARQVLIWGSC
ncbi:hypothetical protein VDGL01_00856 [Verticillium dahliae]